MNDPDGDNSVLTDATAISAMANACSAIAYTAAAGEGASATAAKLVGTAKNPIDDTKKPTCTLGDQLICKIG